MKNLGAIDPEECVQCVVCGVIAPDGTSHFADQPERTHDVHAARLGPGDSIQMVVDLMEHPIEPFPFDFIGGAEQGPEGRTDYFTATFEPGRYVWACHLHASAGMVQEFTVD